MGVFSRKMKKMAQKLSFLMKIGVIKRKISLLEGLAELWEVQNSIWDVLLSSKMVLKFILAQK